MTQNEIFNSMYKGGNFALPYLIKMTHPNFGSLYFVNNNEDIIFDRNTYNKSTFKYTRPKVIGGVLKQGSIQITAIDNNVINILEYSDELFSVTATGIISEDGNITPIKSFNHQWGTATIDESMKVTISFSNDDRLEMVFPPYVFDGDNNRGNA